MSEYSSLIMKVDEILSLFFKELAFSNVRVFNIFSQSEVVVGVMVMGAVFLIDVYASYVLASTKQTKTALLLLEFFAIVHPLAACFLPSAPMRFFCGLVYFATGMSIHSRICHRLLDTNEYSVEPTDASGKALSFTDRFSQELANTLHFNIFNRIQSFGSWRLPTLAEFMRMLVVIVVSDICTYLVREWLPVEGNISAESRSAAIAVVGGVWTLAAMEFAYCVMKLQLGIVGTGLPLELEHRHPLLSNSLTEFWGVRWNPVVGKLLQDAFYKPLRRLGVSRVTCVVACFTGSAVLHAMPQYISTQSPLDSAMMFAFFFLQGVCLVAELGVKHAFGGSSSAHKVVDKPVENKNADVSGDRSITEPPSAATSRVSAQKEAKHHARHKKAVQNAIVNKTAPYQGCAELLLVVCILSSAYYILELLRVPEAYSPEIKARCVAVVVTSFSGAVLLYYIVRRSIHHATQHNAAQKDGGQAERTVGRPYSMEEFSASFLGWVWTVVCIMVLLPLFSLPILHAVECAYEQSFFVGALVRTSASLFPELS